MRDFSLSVIRNYLKNRILVQYQGGREVQTDGVAVTATDGVAVTAIAGIHQYFQDLNRAPNTESGPKDFFEIAFSCWDQMKPLEHA